MWKPLKRTALGEFGVWRGRDQESGKTAFSGQRRQTGKESP